MILISCAEVIKYPTDKNTDAYITLYRAYSGKYRHAYDFLEKRQNKAKKNLLKKGKIFGNLGKNTQNLKIFRKRADRIGLNY